MRPARKGGIGESTRFLRCLNRSCTFKYKRVVHRYMGTIRSDAQVHRLSLLESYTSNRLLYAPTADDLVRSAFLCGTAVRGSSADAGVRLLAALSAHKPISACIACLHIVVRFVCAAQSSPR